MDSRLRIVIDTREQTPWAFDPSVVEPEIGTLKTGDYALAGDLHFGIERKSLDDFLGTISSGWNRFTHELGRMDQAAWMVKPIIVEADFQSVFFATDAQGNLVSPQHRHPKLTPQFIRMRIAELVMNYEANVHFAGDPFLAAGLAVELFKQRQKQLEFQQYESR